MASAASAHFVGSGGAITGLYRGDAQYRQLVDALDDIGCTVLRPTILPA